MSSKIALDLEIVEIAALLIERVRIPCGKTSFEFPLIFALNQGGFKTKKSSFSLQPILQTIQCHLQACAMLHLIFVSSNNIF